MDLHSNPWQIRQAKTIYDNPWITVTEFDVLNPAGKPGIYGKVHFKNAALGIIAMNDRGEIPLVGQYRFPLDRYSWEIPEGGGLHHQDLLGSAQRELLEETGLLAREWKELFQMDLSNSVSDESATIYLATDLQQSTAEPEETEALSLQWVTIDHALGMVLKGEIRDSITVAALLYLSLAIRDKRIMLPKQSS